jgi:hypothetical protein
VSKNAGRVLEAGTTGPPKVEARLEPILLRALVRTKPALCGFPAGKRWDKADMTYLCGREHELIRKDGPTREEPCLTQPSPEPLSL